MKCVIPNQLLNSLILDIEKPKIISTKLFSLNKKIDLENTDINLYIRSYTPSLYVAQEELFFFSIANIINDTRSHIPTVLIQCDVDLDPYSIYTDSIYEKNYLLYAKVNKFKATNFKYLTFEDICFYFSITKEYLEKHPIQSINQEDLLDAFTFCTILNNDTSLFKMIVQKYNVSLMPKNRPYSFKMNKNYEYLFYAINNLNKDIIEYILNNTPLRMDSYQVKELIASCKSVSKLKELLRLYKYFTSKSLTINDFKGLGKLRYLRCLL